jgi:GAF domain-containing protein
VSQQDAQAFVIPRLLVEHGIQASMTDVVRSRTHNFGVLGAFSKSDRTWTSDEATFLRTVGALIGGIMMRFEVESALSNSESR